MSAADLLLELGRLGIRLEAHGDRLQYFPQSALTPDLLGRLRANKSQLLVMLQTKEEPGEIDDRSATAIWTAALELLVNDELFSIELLDALQAAEIRWVEDPANARLAQVNLAVATLPKAACRCGSTICRDVTIHNGESVRRDCGVCGRFLDFVMWYGKNTASDN